MCHETAKKKKELIKKMSLFDEPHCAPFELTVCPCLHFETFDLLKASVTAGPSLSSLLEKHEWKPD